MSTSAHFREPPPTTVGQRHTILRLLRQAAMSNRGVSGDCLRFEHNIRQAPTRIFELRNDFGYGIRTEQDQTTRCAVYFFVNEPPANWNPPVKQERFQLASSFQRRRREEKSGAMPLFAKGAA
jgi:hypothetical protein